MTPPNPRREGASFRDLALSPALTDVAAELGFVETTPIQAQSIPFLLEGRDLVGRSKTGSGKTVAFVLPILAKLALDPRRPQALVLCPTRELCVQVARETRRLGRKLPGLHVLELAGGQPAKPQREALEKGVHVIVGTPGRVLDLLARGAVDVAAIATVVLDEADRMLDMGFERDMLAILKALPTTRQTAFFSATFPDAIATMSARFQRDPVRVTVDDANEAARDIREVVHATEPDRKFEALLDVLRRHPHESAIVFCNLKATAAELERALVAAGSSAEALHGDLEQRERDRVMAKFRNGSTRVLVATDVAARGIDVASVDVVVNYDLPTDAQVYVHRIGRTGRAGRTGVAISLATARDEARLDAIAKATGVTPERDSATPDEVAPASEPVERNPAMVTLFISGGRKDKVRPGDILGALTGEAGGLSAADVGKIEIHDHFAYVAVSRAVAEKARDGLARGKIKGRRFRVGFAD